ncbi:hypothetical protein KAFR_0A04190 [Kazachstania africana CBS 2517]|uniref:Uncharacterized protein n=1 Tax=Kazachstania africana (strain ATCC 22294 / BCRC 22015 / CBS 2517 / CECT 1963 / NBRC 1671 / NRRL Y-8276) TaxID=1071382 RepID=H2ANA4_KAZAF|nr:hypothetical protein KAFR_0A04190 [Kazachstania africana CBS 2517]CCF55854.1 hypothetical protein KAFR_0A04190 [Kazachstania africana CBS 2517]
MFSLSIGKNSIKQLKELNEKSAKLTEDIANLVNNLKPLEFESYTDYFLINTFQKGISESGKVDINDIRRRDHTRYYKKIKHDEDATTTALNGSSVNTSKSPTPTLNDDFPKIKLGPNEDDDRESRSNSSDYIEDKKPNEKVTKNSRSTVADHNIRRSSRLSQKEQLEKQKNETEEAAKEAAEAEQDSADIKIADLYESLVPKIVDPSRRSDWVLPPRFRFTPEKQYRTKADYEHIKINELIANKKIRTVLSKFDGGVAGIRKRDWNSVADD